MSETLTINNDVEVIEVGLTGPQGPIGLAGPLDLVYPWEVPGLVTLLNEGGFRSSLISSQERVSMWFDTSGELIIHEDTIGTFTAGNGYHPYASGLRGRPAIRCVEQRYMYGWVPQNQPFEMHILFRQEDVWLDEYSDPGKAVGYVEGATIVGGDGVDTEYMLSQGTVEGDLVLNLGLPGPTVNVPLGETVHLMIVADGANSSLQVDDGTPVVGDAGTAGLYDGAFYIGAGNVTYADVDIAGLMVWDGTLTAEQRTGLLKYWR